MSDRLGTAQWEEQALVSQRYPFAQGKFWLGRAQDATAIGYHDDRHICLVSGTRGGKGTSIIVNNLCFWPGSTVVVDPKGENATVTAGRRGQGSEYCAGMGQAVHVLDPFKTAHVDERYRSSFNPLADLDPQLDETIDEASRLANALVVVKDDSHEPFWDEAARSLLHGLILYVLTARHFMKAERNLITVRDLILRGEWQIADTIRAQGHSEEKIDPPHLLLWRKMEKSQAFNGLVAGIGSRFRALMKSAEKTYEGVLQSLVLHTEFIDSPGMRRVLAKSDFKLSELKTRPEGMTLYLSLPQRYMDTHYRWLRMMVALTTTEMEITRGQPATGHPVLMVLDEFAGLKRMAAIENAVAQIAGFGVKLLFVLQSLEQLKAIYKDNWETFLANAGVKVFFSIEDHFTCDYVSKLVGETEIIRELRNSNESQSENESYSEGRSQSQTSSQSNTIGTSRSVNQSRTQGVNSSRNSSESSGINESFGWSEGMSTGVSTSVDVLKTSGFFPSGVRVPHDTFSEGRNSSVSGSGGTSRGTSHGTSEGTSSGTSRGTTFGSSDSETIGSSTTRGTSQTYTSGSSRTLGAGRSESVHRRPLIQPNEVARTFARIDDRSNPAYPGFALVILTGANPLVLKRTQYFDDPQFIRCFSPHPDHKFLPLPSSAFDVAKIRKLLDDYWHDEATHEQTQVFLRAELDDLEKSHAAFCATITDSAKKTTEWRCEFVRDNIFDVFTLALAKKSGKKDWWGITPTYLHKLIDYVVAESESTDLVARRETRPASIKDPANLNAEDYAMLAELVPGLKKGFPNIRHLIGHELEPFFPLPEKPRWVPTAPAKPPSNQLSASQLLIAVLVFCAIGGSLAIGVVLLFVYLPTLIASSIVGAWIFLLVYGHITKSMWGMNLALVRCPKCQTAQPRLRKPTDQYERKWGGCTCARCGTKMDKWGRLRPI